MRLGQNFMIDEKFLKLVVAAAELKSTDQVLEIGPGEGALTELLLEKCSVTAIEKDSELFDELEDKFPSMVLLNEDAIKVNWPTFNKCVSNLPYLISKKFFLKLFQNEFDLAVIVVQKEFAEKLVANVGDKDYGVVSVCAQLCCDVELLDKIPRNAFKPQPRVESRIVRMKQTRILDKGLLEFITLHFQQRNKLLGEKRVRDITPTEFLTLYEKK